MVDLFSDRYIERVNAFNLFFHSGMLIYTMFWGNKWFLITWIPMTALAVYLYRKNARRQAKKQ